MTNSIDISKAAQQLLNSEDILILCHKNPDGDTIGSAGGLLHSLKQLGKRCAILCQDVFPARFDFMYLDLFTNQFTPKFIVSVDVATAHLFGDKLSSYDGNVDLCIDHHPSNSGYAKMVCCDGDLPATAQLMLSIIELMGVEIDACIADCLYTGLVTDTGCFKYSSTTAETHLAAAKLMQFGAHHIEISGAFFMSKSRKNIELEKCALSTLEFLYDGKCAIIYMTKDVLDKIQPESTDIEGISSMPRAIEGVDVGITLRQISESSFKISVRTSENADACEIAQGLGGGGHRRAAGCEVTGSLESAKKAIIKEVEKAICR